jgi:nitroreductase
MELSETLQSNASYRSFTDQPVSDEELRGILDLARFAPSGGNRQPWEVIIVKDPNRRNSLEHLYQLAWREYMAHVELGLVPFAPTDHGRWSGPAIDLEEARRRPAPSSFADNLATVPALLVVCVRLDQLAVLDNGLERQSIVGGGSIYPFCHNIMLAARSRGLGGVMTTVICRQESAVRELLAIPNGVAVAALLALGYPDKVVTRLKRHDPSTFTHLDTFTQRPPWEEVNSAAPSALK